MMCVYCIGHVDVIRWLMEQKECTGNERDYYQCTPLHDAAEHGHLKWDYFVYYYLDAWHNNLHRAIQALCEAGADHLLTDIEGNFPKDLAEKNHHSKCARYLASLGKSKVPKAKKSSNSKMVCDFIRIHCCYGSLATGYFREQIKTTTKS